MKFAVIALFAAAAATASVDAKTTKLHVRVHAHNEKQGAICYKQCPQGQWCSRGQSECRGPKAGTTECFNYATALWIPKCDPGFVCRNGKCDYAKKSKSATKHHEDDHDHDEDDEGDDDEEREYGDDDDDDEERDGDDDEHEDEHEGEDDGEGPPPKHRKSHRQSKQGAICYKQCPQGQWCARGTQTCRGPKAGTTECFNYATALWIPKCDPGFVCRNGKCDYAKKLKSATKHHEDDHDHDDEDGEGEDEERDGDEDDEDHDHEDEDDEERAYGDEHEGEDDGEGPPPKHLKSHRQSKQGAICYKQCPQGQWCARGTQTCRGPKAGTSECFNYATAQWIAKCDPGFVCRNGKCDYK